MPSISVTSYLVDENGDFILDTNGDRLILGSVDHDFDWGGARAVSSRRCNGVKSFDVSTDNNGAWRATVNKSKFLGLFENKTTALGAVVGTFINSGASSLEKISAAWSDQLSRGASSIEDEAAPVQAVRMNVAKAGMLAVSSVIYGTVVQDLFGNGALTQLQAVQAQGQLTFIFASTVPLAVGGQTLTMTVDGRQFTLAPADITVNGSTVIVANQGLVDFMVDAARPTSYDIVDMSLS